MDRFSSFSTRLKPTLPFMGGWFVAGFSIAVWNPQPKLILTVAIGISVGMLILGPYAAAALYGLRMQRFLKGHLRWPLCLILATTTVLLLDYALKWSILQLVLAGVTAVIGTILGHDATLVVLELKHNRHLDRLMVVFFPLLIGISVIAGYSSFGFGAGMYQFLAALFR